MWLRESPAMSPRVLFRATGVALLLGTLLLSAGGESLAQPEAALDLSLDGYTRTSIEIYLDKRRES